MKLTTTSQRLLPSLLCLLLGFGLGAFSLAHTHAVQNKPPIANVQERGIDANLYMQTAAEYTAVCLQTYGWALERLRQKLAVNKPSELRPAVVMDLDETVLDNSGYQAFLYQQNLPSADALWEVWERDFPQEVRLVPGARQFIQAAEHLGVVVVYLSNRTAKNSAGTIAALKHVGLNIDGIADRLLLKTDTSDKSARRKLAETRFNVLLYFGDNLRDFSEEFLAPSLAANDDAGQQRAIAERIAKVEARNYRWGNDWIVLPNPTYGEWMKLLGNDPARKFRQTEMKLPKSN